MREIPPPLPQFTFHTYLRPELSGTVKDQKSREPLIGATIGEKGTSNGTTTDFDGKFKLIVSKLPATLIISYVGYQTREIPVSNSTTPLELTLAFQEVIRATVLREPADRKAT